MYLQSKPPKLGYFVSVWIPGPHILRFELKNMCCLPPSPCRIMRQHHLLWFRLQIPIISLNLTSLRTPGNIFFKILPEQAKTTSLSNRGHVGCYGDREIFFSVFFKSFNIFHYTTIRVFPQDHYLRKCAYLK